MKEIVIDISEDGEIRLETRGLKGKACIEEAALLKGLLGHETHRQLVPAYWQGTRMIEQNLMRRVNDNSEWLRARKYIPPIEDFNRVLMIAQGDDRDLLLVLYHTAGRRREVLERLTLEDVTLYPSCYSTPCSLDSIRQAQGQPEADTSFSGAPAH